MRAGQRYRTALLALGWLLLIGVLIRSGFGARFRTAYGGVEDSLARVGQTMSNAEGSVRRRLRGTSRRADLAPFAPLLSSAERLRNPDQPLFGAYDGGLPASFEGLARLEERLNFGFPIIAFYSAWGDRPNEQFPVRMLETIRRLGSVPMVTWEPWVTDFDPTIRRTLPSIDDREYRCLSAIARGDYDFYIVPWAADAARYGAPFFLRFAHEMNDPYRYPWGPQTGNQAEDFLAAWKHVHAIFEKVHATNVLWVWSPHINMPWFENYYPGADQVDWIATAALNYGKAAPWSRWWTLRQILENAYPSLVKLGKPIMLAEFGTLSAGGDEVQWHEDAIRDLRDTYPAVRSVVFFNQASDTTLTRDTRLAGPGLDWSILQSPRATAVWRSALAKGKPVNPASR